jgi:DNA-binding IclR family transcriptional regulator
MNNTEVDSPISRRWKLLEQLSSTPKGATVDELATASGVNPKTIRRDLVMLKQLGFDLQSTENVFGLKWWRIRHPFEELKTKHKQYRHIRKTLETLIEQSRSIDDLRLVADLKVIHRKLGK